MISEELKIDLLNTAYFLQEANNDIEVYLPPDDSGSWGDDAEDLLNSRDEIEARFDALIDEIQAQAIEEAIRYASDKVRNVIPHLAGDADLVSSENLKSYANQLRQSAEGEE